MLLNPKIRPFLKWPGNKYRCLEHILPRLSSGKRLIEPFMGSGAIFLNTNYPVYHLNDQNAELIHLFQFIKDEGQIFIDDCKKWFTPDNNEKKRYQELRALFNQTQNLRERATLFLYLNRHAFNGLCRFNQQGGFNVPFGSFLKPYFPEKEMLLFHEKSHHCTFNNQDFSFSFTKTNQNDVIYCDPPYHPLSSTASFTAYTKLGFNTNDQIKLAELALAAAKRGSDVFISNHDTPFTQELYKEATHIYQFKVSRTISSKGNQRHAVPEILAYFKGR